MRIFLLTSLLTLAPLSIAAANGGFNGAGGFSFYLCKPDLDPINDELKGLGMPQFDDVMILYGGQGFAHVSYRLRIGGMGYGGQMTVKDTENGYAREVNFDMAWGGVLVEYILLETRRLEAYGGGTIGWGGISVHLEKSSSPVSWDEVWGEYQATPDTSDHISTNLEHSFFLLQPRLGLRYYLTDWLAVSGSVDLTLIHLNSQGWTLNGDDLYDAPSFNMTQPFFQIAFLFGG